MYPFTFLFLPPSYAPYHHNHHNHMDSTPIFKYSVPKGDSLEPPPSSHPILSNGYEIHPAFIAMVRELPFYGRDDENPYSHLREFEHLCSCLVFSGMTQETIKWKLFPFSLLGRAKQWYAHTVGGVHGDWVELRDKFCLTFFPNSRVAALQIEILKFNKKRRRL